MNRLLYNIFLHILAAPLLTAYYGPQVVLGQKYRRSLGGKLGKLPKNLVIEQLRQPRIWFHAVSVGEVNALNPLVRALKGIQPDSAFLVSTGTETGQDTARGSIPQADGLFYLPLDFPGLVNKLVDRIRPDMFVLMETELWPNLIHALKKSGARVALANGRISDRSYPRYKKFRWFFEEILQQIDIFLMASELDAARIVAIGAPEDRIRVTGNTKFDAAMVKNPDGIESKMRQMLQLKGSEQVVVAGSTHPGEHEIVLKAYGELSTKFPELILVLVPRHAERTPQILAYMKDQELSDPFLRSSLDQNEQRNGRKIVVWDRMGELFEVFSVASAVFMGGSLVPKGGQNILEPASWGKAVLFGPSMEDFRDAREILSRAGAGIQVSGGDELTQRLESMLSDPQGTELLGARGREEIARHTGSAARNAELLVHQLRAKENR